MGFGEFVYGTYQRVYSAYLARRLEKYRKKLSKNVPVYEDIKHYSMMGDEVLWHLESRARKDLLDTRKKIGILEGKLAVCKGI